MCRSWDPNIERWELGIGNAVARCKLQAERELKLVKETLVRRSAEHQGQLEAIKAQLAECAERLDKASCKLQVTSYK